MGEKWRTITIIRRRWRKKNVVGMLYKSKEIGTGCVGKGNG